MDLVDKWQAGLLTSKEVDSAMHSIDGVQGTTHSSEDDNPASLLMGHLREEHEAEVPGQFQDTFDDFPQGINRTVDRAADMRETSSNFPNPTNPDTPFGATLWPAPQGPSQSQFATGHPPSDSPLSGVFDPFEIKPLSIHKRGRLPFIPSPPPPVVRKSHYNSYYDMPVANWAVNPGYGNRNERLEAVGIVYLASSQDYNDPLRRGELSFGSYILPEYRFNPQIGELMNEMVGIAFKDPQCARLQAIVVDNQDKYENLKFFTNL